ncbi:MAG: acylneuraminate cytidylyltransferase [Alkalispirochaeta sp.]
MTDPSAAKTALFIQVRLASTRLPGKALLPLGDSTVIGQAMKALSGLAVAHHVLLTDSTSAPLLKNEAERNGYEIFVGDPHDVLHRYCRAARSYGVECLIRATGDNPFTSKTVTEMALKLRHHRDADYAGISGTPFGTGVEVIKTDALFHLEKRTTDSYEREHVSPGLYRRPDVYRVVLQDAPAELYMPDLRVTLDTPTDYDYIAGIYRELYRGNPIEIPELIAYGQRYHKNSA